jgi:hypothetical protein
VDDVVNYIVDQLMGMAQNKLTQEDLANIRATLTVATPDEIMGALENLGEVMKKMGGEERVAEHKYA